MRTERRATIEPNRVIQAFGRSSTGAGVPNRLGRSYDPRKAENNNNDRRDCDQSRDERVSVHFSSMVAALKKAVARALL